MSEKIIQKILSPSSGSPSTSPSSGSPSTSPSAATGSPSNSPSAATGSPAKSPSSGSPSTSPSAATGSPAESPSAATGSPSAKRPYTSPSVPPDEDSVICPYYRSQSGFALTCSRWEGSSPHRKCFCSTDYKRQYMNRYCRCRFDDCKIARSIMRLQLEEEAEWMP